MAKQRAVRRTDEKPDARVAMPCDHPDGGTIHIYPLGAIDGQALQDDLRAVDYELDENGATKLDGEGKPIPNSLPPHERLARRIDAIRKHCVAKVTNVVDAADPTQPDGSPKLIELTNAAAINDFLNFMSMREVEQDLPVRIFDAKTETWEIVVENGKPKLERKNAPAKELVSAWVSNRALELGFIGGAEEKNSSTTPSGGGGLPTT